MKKIFLLIINVIVISSIVFTQTDKIASQAWMSEDGTQVWGTKLGTQVWGTENLNGDKFRNGDNIPEAKTDAEWEKALVHRKPAWCYYKNDSTDGVKVGKLYNWYAVNDSRGLAPLGWHIPSLAEWNTLNDYLNSSKIKLQVLYNGCRCYDFQYRGERGNWWSSSENGLRAVYYISIDRDNQRVNIEQYQNYDNQLTTSSAGKHCGFSVRFLKD
jgi:uncharacterized protein (TIGR02145 family)